MMDASQLVVEKKVHVVSMNKQASTWYWVTANPRGGSFSSNHCGSKTVALHAALRSLDVGAPYFLITNGRLTGPHAKGESTVKRS